MTSSLSACVHEHEAARAVGVLGHAGEAGLAEQRALLVARHAADADAVAQQVGREVAKWALDGSTSGFSAGDAQQRHRSSSHWLVCTLNSMVREALLTSVTCTWPWVSCHISQLSTVPKASSPRSAASRAPGTWSSSHCSLVVDMAREGLQLNLRNALHAAGQNEPTLNMESSIKSNGDRHATRFSVRPMPGPDASQKLLLVSFQETTLPIPGKRPRGKGVAPGDAELRRVEELEYELAYNKENLQATIEEQQASNEELKSTNEELQSTNEELQSTNEELETSKEESNTVSNQVR